MLLSTNQVPIAKRLGLGRFFTLGEDLLFPGLGSSLNVEPVWSTHEKSWPRRLNGGLAEGQ